MTMPRRRALQAVVAALTMALAGLLWLAPAPLVAVQEKVFDQMAARLRLPPADPPVVVVDIGEVDETGLPWTRAATARLVQALAGSGPRVLAFDIVFSGDCAPGLVNDALARSLGTVPSVLGFLLTDTATLPPGPRPPLALAGPGPGWIVPGAEGACPAFARAAQAAAPVALSGDADGLIRRAPMVVAVAGQAYPALAAEVARLALNAPAPLILTGPGAALRLPGRHLHLETSGDIRLIPQGAQDWARRTLQAETILSGGVDRARIAGAVVLIGSSLPKRGGLRATAASPVHPSVQIHADLVQAILAGRAPWRANAGRLAEGTVVAIGGFALVALSRRGLRALWVVAGLVAGWLALAALALWRADLLIDPVLPGLALLLLAALAVFGQAAASARAERALRARMGQLLPPAVVTRLANAPDLFRLEGEARTVTALFTDIEGFTLTTRSLGPQALVRLLDGYFTLTTAIVLRHGGMIDKIVGDSLHVLFNAPLDQPGHVDAALACAADLIAATEAHRRQTGLGRTRIGIETGPVILGDVGAGGKIDYTAHGDAVNLAARLQDANKDLGTQVCIGPAAAAETSTPLRPLGQVEVRSFGPLPLFTLA